MAKIECKLCNDDTGYTTSTPIEDRTRSISVGSGGKAPKGTICFCTKCWDDKGIGANVTSIRSS